MKLEKLFENASYQHAFQKWHDVMISNKIWMEPKALENIAEAQSRPRPASFLRAYSAMEYFGRAAWDKDMPAIKTIQIYDLKTPSGVPAVFKEDVQPFIEMRADLERHGLPIPKW